MKIQTTKMLRTTFCTAAIVAMLGLPATAETAPKHAEAAKQYRLQAEALDAEATKQEDQAIKLARSAGAAAYKWPAIVNRYQEVKEKAIQARRQATENRMLADHHTRLVVEAQASPTN